ncbi:MAG TPA: phage tail protein, partial [Longimicrobiaceae bacterium]|nr:phage tail protein [Longimicrobiaceae bacterium]
WSRRLLRAAALGGGRRPLDLASDGHTVWVAAGAGGLLTMTAREGPADVALPAGAGAPERIAVSAGGAVVLLAGGGTAAARVVPLDRPGEGFAVPGATDLEWEGEGVLVVARLPGEDFLRFRIAAGSRVALPPYAARRYDGTGIARDPDGGIGFWTEGGFRHATAARLRYAADGRVTTYRLDSGEYQTTWGRLFVDACIPAGTSVWARCVTADETFDGPVLPRTAPGNVEAGTIPRPDLSPPMPPLSLVEQGGEWHPLHRRETGREQAWVQPGDDDPYATYEAPVIAAPGRFLWVALELRGNTRLTPRVRCLRVERSAHDWLRRLPRAFSREDEVAGFLGRFLAIFEGTLGEMEGRAALREALLDPAGTPQDMLPWLASFLGLALDRRWPVAARRTLVAEAAWLFRFRGTVRGLSRWLEIYLGVPVFLVELFRLRGTGGTLGGEADLPASSSAVLGAGFRVGGAVGVMEESPLAGSTDDAFRTHAHRFTVIVPRLLSEEQRAVVEDVLQVHRPAHTLFDVCTPGAGMRIGRGLHLGLSSVIGRTGGFGTLRLGGSALGREAVLGRPVPATRPGASRLGADSRAG